MSRDGAGTDRRAGMEWKLRGARVVGKDTVGVSMRTGERACREEGAGEVF